MLGINSYRLPQDTGRLMRAKGVQRATFGRAVLGTNTYGAGTQFASRLIARGREMQAFGMGKEGEVPWYQALFTHIETMSVTMAPFVLQVLDMSFDQQKAGWARTDAREREQAYQTMIMSLVGDKTGTSKYSFSDPKTRDFLLKNFRNEPAGTQNSVIDSLTGGDPNLTASISALTLPWYKQYSITVPIVGVGVVGVLALVWMTRR